MDPRLVRVFERGDANAEVAAIVRLQDAAGPPPPGARVIARFGHIATVRLRRAAIPVVHDARDVISMKPGAPLLREARVPDASAASTADDRDARRSATQTATGQGVIVGIVDWGFDFAHPEFRNADGSTRLLALWDQGTPPGPSSPEPYGYGIVHLPGAINAALATADPYGALGYDPADSDLDGGGTHGTHVAGIAAGNGRVTGVQGIAPAADIVFVQLTTLDPDDDDLADSVAVLEAIDFIRAMAGTRPFVVNLSMGQCGDPHDGTTLLEQGLDAVLDEAPGRAIVQSTGNYYASRQHSSGRLRQNKRRGLPWQVPADGGTNQLEVWYPGTDAFTVTLRAPDGTQAGRAACGETTAVQLGNRSCGALHNRRRDPNNLDNHVVLWLDADAPGGIWQVGLLGSTVVDGRYHVWVQRDSDDGGQAAFASDDANPFFTTNSVCNGHRTVAVGAYDARAAHPDIAGFSSAGPTRDGRAKPDLLAPGVQVVSACSTPAGAPAGSGGAVRMSGTSMAAPHVAGTMALMFEVAPRPLWSEEARALLLPSARTAGVRGRAAIRYGAGYLDTDAAVAAARLIDAKTTARGVMEMAAPSATAPQNDTDQNGRSGPLALADTLIGIGGPFAACPQALLARVLSGFADPTLVDPIAAASLFDPATLFDAFITGRLAGLRPGLDPLFAVVAYPRQMLAAPLRPGDVMIRRTLGEPGMGHAAFIAGQDAYPPDEALRRGLMPESRRPGLYARVVEPGTRPHQMVHRFARRVMEASGRVPPDMLILRPRYRSAALSERVVRIPAEDVDLSRAVPANRQYATQLGWGSRYDDIVALLGLNASPSEDDFAQSVATWQGQHGLTSDGMLGPDTWTVMQPLLPAPSPTPPAPSPPTPPTPIDVNKAVQSNRQYAVQLGWATRFDDIVALLGFNSTPTEQDFANGVAVWQGQHALSVDGIIGPDTWAAMQPLLVSPPLPVPPTPTPPGPTPPAPTPPTPVPPSNLIGTDLTNFVRGVSMGLTSDSAATLKAPSGSGPITFALSDPEGWNASLTINASGATASALRFPTEGMTGTVMDSLIWSNLSITDSTATGGAGIGLPLTQPFVLGTGQTSSGRTKIAGGTVDLFPLETEIQAYATCVFGYLVDGSAGTVSPLDLSTVPAGQLQQFLSNHGSVTPVSTTNTALIAVYDLSLTSPKDDYQPTGGAPMGLANVVRTYPLLSLWSSRPLSAASAKLDMARPATSMMGGMARGGAISGALYTDVNAGLRTLWDDTNPTIKLFIGGNTLIPWMTVPAATLIAVYQVAPSTRWNSIFAHYSLDAARSNITVVAPGLARRTNSSDRQVWDTGSATYLPTAVTKVERQGMFDNVHVAPVMDYQGVAAYMAPLCHHDCLHIHWRWGESYTDKAVTGWSGGKPYQKAGAPMIPENQTLQVSIAGPRVTYSPSAASVPAQTWQIFMHHGTGYVSSLTAVGAMTPLMEMAQLGSLPGFAQFYYHNRMYETGATRPADTPRLKESGFGPLETM